MLFEPDCGQVHVLNASAAAIWRSCDGARSTHDIAHLLGVADRGPEIARAVDELHAHRLLTADDAATSGERPTIGTPAPVRQELLVRSLLLDAAGRRVAVVVQDDVLRDELSRRLTGLVIDDRACPYPARVIAVAPLDRSGEDRTLSVREHDHDLVCVDSLDHLVSWLINFVSQVATGQRTDFVMLHAAGALIDGEAVVLPGPSGSGKSTTVAEMVRAGAGYLGDEALGVVAGTTHVVPYPKPVTVKSGRSRQHVVAVHLHEDALAWRHRDHDLTIGRIVFPHHEPHAAVAASELEPLESLLALAESTFNLRETGQRGLDTLHHLATTVDCIRVVYGDAVAAVDAILASR